MGYNASMTTPAAAREIAEAYLAAERPWSVLSELLEDDQGYFVREDLKPGHQWPLGPGALFIDKASGTPEVVAWGEAFARINAMAG